MSIDLKKEEKNLLGKINYRMGIIKEKLEHKTIDDDVTVKISEMGKYAHMLHISLKKRNIEPKHHAYMIKNRGVKPDDESFYMHIHPVEDLIAFIKDPSANDDRDDKTLGETFKLKIYSKRYDQEDVYHITRTPEGWNMDSSMFLGPFDKRGDPLLIQRLNFDNPRYPRDFIDRFEWVWEQAASKALSKREVQAALDELSEWVNDTTKRAPSGVIWESYSTKLKKTIKTGVIKTGVITFLDVLGWKGVYSRKKNAIDTLIKLIDELKKHADDQRGKINNNVNIRSISDTIVIFTPCSEKEANIAIDIHGELCKWIIPRSIELEIPIRGATSFGEFETVDNIFVGKAVDEAAAWHEQADWIGVHLTPSAEYIFEDNGDDDLWIMHQLPGKFSAKWETHCVNWKLDLEGKRRNIGEIKAKFLLLGPIVPEITGKFANTIIFINNPVENKT